MRDLSNIKKVSSPDQSDDSAEINQSDFSEGIKMKIENVEEELKDEDQRPDW